MVIKTTSDRKLESEQCADRSLGKRVELAVLAIIYRLGKRM